MEIEKWLPGLICAAALAGGFAMSFEIARGATHTEASPQPAITTKIEREKPSFFAPSESKPASCDADLSVKQYYLDHTSEFAPLPHSPRARAEAMRQIAATIRQKLNTGEKS